MPPKNKDGNKAKAAGGKTAAGKKSSSPPSSKRKIRKDKDDDELLNEALKKKAEPLSPAKERQLAVRLSFTPTKITPTKFTPTKSPTRGSAQARKEHIRMQHMQSERANEREELLAQIAALQARLAPDAASVAIHVKYVTPLRPQGSSQDAASPTSAAKYIVATLTCASPRGKGGVEGGVIDGTQLAHAGVNGGLGLPPPEASAVATDNAAPTRPRVATYRTSTSTAVVVTTQQAVATDHQHAFVLIAAGMFKDKVWILGQVVEITESAGLTTCFTATVFGATLHDLHAKVGNMWGRLDFTANFSHASLVYAGEDFSVDGASITRPRGLAPLVAYLPALSGLAAFLTFQDLRDVICGLPHLLKGSTELQVPQGFVITKQKGTTALYSGLQPLCATALAAIARLARLPVTATGDGPQNVTLQFWWNRHAGFKNSPAGQPRRFLFTDAYASIAVFPGATPTALNVQVTIRFWPGFGNVRPMWT